MIFTLSLAFYCGMRYNGIVSNNGELDESG